MIAHQGTVSPVSSGAGQSPESSGWIVCMGGEDWWYHSHAHFDIQIMKRLAQRCRVLYVCSIGMRMPSLRRDKQFWKRIANKLHSVRHVLHRVHPQLWVYSPLPIPLYQSACGRAINHAVLSAQVRAALSWLHIRRPLFWINTPTAWAVVKNIGRRGVVYQRTDKYAEYDFDNFNAGYVRALDEELLQGADLVVHVDKDLHADAQPYTRAAMLLEQGVDESFFDTVAVNTSALTDLPAGSGPMIGYVGTLEPHKFDAALVEATARRLPECRFIIIGPYHQNAEDLRKLGNVHFLGRKRHDEIVPYVRAFDICMLPTARTEWGLHCKPLKLMEYLAAGRPVVATDIPAVAGFREAIHVSNEPDGWAAAIRTILESDHPADENMRQRLTACSWNRQADRIWSVLDEYDLVYRSNDTHERLERSDVLCC